MQNFILLLNQIFYNFFTKILKMDKQYTKKHKIILFLMRALKFLSCEIDYYNNCWGCLKHQNFIHHRINASLIRYFKLIKSFHMNLYIEFLFTPHELSPSENSIKQSVDNITIPLKYVEQLLAKLRKLLRRHIKLIGKISVNNAYKNEISHLKRLLHYAISMLELN